MNRSVLVAALALALTACNTPSPNAGESDAARLKAASVRNNDKPDTSKAPGVDEPEPRSATGQPLQGQALRQNQIRTRHVVDGAITAGKIAITATTVTVSLGAATGSSAADPTQAGGFLIGCHPSTNQDQFVDNVVLNGDGSITITLAANATAANVFRCTVLRANAQGVS